MEQYQLGEMEYCTLNLYYMTLWNTAKSSNGFPFGMHTTVLFRKDAVWAVESNEQLHVDYHKKSGTVTRTRTEHRYHKQYWFTASGTLLRHCAGSVAAWLARIRQCCEKNDRESNWCKNTNDAILLRFNTTTGFIQNSRYIIIQEFVIAAKDLD